MNELHIENPADGVQTISYDGSNFIRAVESGSWCVAFLNHGDRFITPTYIERHLETDEIFVLLSGEATLFIGKEMIPVKMTAGKAYTVKKSVWHQIVTTVGTRCLIVENANTCAANSERMECTISSPDKKR